MTTSYREPDTDTKTLEQLEEEVTKLRVIKADWDRRVDTAHQAQRNAMRFAPAAIIATAAPIAVGYFLAWAGPAIQTGAVFSIIGAVATAIAWGIMRWDT